MSNHTRNECRRCKITLETSEEDVKSHLKPEWQSQNYTPNGRGKCKTTLESSGEDVIQVEFEALKPIKVKGKANPIDIFRPLR